MERRTIYLNNLPLEDAKKVFEEKLESYGSIEPKREFIKVEDSLKRISAKPVFAEISCPHYNASAMDGIAVRAFDTFGASEKNAVTLELVKDFLYVNTGETLPQDFDSVIKIEEIVQNSPTSITIIKGAVSWQNVRPIGEDIAAKELIIPSNHEIAPVDIGAMLAGGVNEIEVYTKPRIGIIPTGSELVESAGKLKKGQIIDFNSKIFAAMITSWEGSVIKYPIVGDEVELIKMAIKKAISECDVVIVSAGSSAGSRDYTAKVIDELGEVLVHGIAVQPGKPAILGIVNKKPVIGVPGYPVSAYIIMELVVKPLFFKMAGKVSRPIEMVTAQITKKLVSSLKFDEYVRVKVGNIERKLIASPLNRGAGVVMSLVRADGLLKVPRNCEGYEAGESVEIILKRNIEDIENTIVIIGSHDPILDILSDLLHKKFPCYSVASSHVGSMGGIMALKRGETHLAGSHLLDTNDGSYNVSYIKKYLDYKSFALLHLVGRTQGFMVKQGNPKSFRDFKDLERKDISFINRQKGSGTRMLLDYYILQNSISPEKINGYAHEEYTHLTTAAGVFEGDADVALGVYSAAKAMNLDFIPVCEEQYDLVVPIKFLEQQNIKSLIRIIESEEFKNIAIGMGGYDISKTGEISFIS